MQDDGKGEGDGDGEKRFDGSGYDKDLVEALERDILQKNPNVHWYVIQLITSVLADLNSNFGLSSEYLTITCICHCLSVFVYLVFTQLST